MNAHDFNKELKPILDRLGDLYWQVQAAIDRYEQKQQAQKSPSEEGQESQ